MQGSCWPFCTYVINLHAFHVEFNLYSLVISSYSFFAVYANEKFAKNPARPRLVRGQGWRTSQISTTQSQKLYIWRCKVKYRLDNMMTRKVRLVTKCFHQYCRVEFMKRFRKDWTSNTLNKIYKRWEIIICILILLSMTNNLSPNFKMIKNIKMSLLENYEKLSFIWSSSSQYLIQT